MAEHLVIACDASGFATPACDRSPKRPAMPGPFAMRRNLGTPRHCRVSGQPAAGRR
jgi:hypothetical protein